MAAIDIGSNSIRAIVADVSSTGQIRTVDEMKAAPRLSTGVDETGRLSVESALAAIEALQRMVSGLNVWRPAQCGMPPTGPRLCVR